jgi:hypothetical protein
VIALNGVVGYIETTKFKNLCNSSRAPVEARRCEARSGRNRR